MTARDLFGLALRLAALWIFVWGTWQLVAAVVYFLPTIESWINRSRMTYSSFDYFLYGFPADVVAVVVLRFADQIVAFTYRK